MCIGPMRCKDFETHDLSNANEFHTMNTKYDLKVSRNSAHKIKQLDTMRFKTRQHNHN